MTTRDHIREWLMQLAARIGATLEPDDLAGRIDLLVDDLAEEGFPVEAFTRASMRYAAIQHPRYWPTFGELHATLSAWQRESRLTFGMLLSDHRAYEPPPKPPERTPEEISHVERLVNETVAMLRHHEVEKEAQYAAQRPGSWHRPAPELTRAQLTEAYKRAGVKGPQLPEPPKAEVVPMRLAAAKAPREVKRGPIVDGKADE